MCLQYYQYKKILELFNGLLITIIFYIKYFITLYLCVYAVVIM